MKILLTNDDGIDAPGLSALHAVAQQLGEVIVAAPALGHSGCSHRVTWHEPFHVEQRRPGWFAVAGTPADCIRVALHSLVEDVDWVLSGINEGGNLGADVWYSGTVAAAREATLHGLRAVAVSHYIRRDRPLDWERGAGWALKVLQGLIEAPLDASSFWNVNLPHPARHEPDPETAFCPLDTGPLPVSFHHEAGRLLYNGDYHGRPRLPGADVDVCFGGRIAVTRLILG